MPVIVSEEEDEVYYLNGEGLFLTPHGEDILLWLSFAQRFVRSGTRDDDKEQAK